MAGRLIGGWNPALDSGGTPISGSLLHTYTAGTTTPKQTFTDPGLLTPLANPVVADSAGRFPEIWGADGATYDLKWCTAADVQIELFQSIQTLGSTATGAVTRDFGANGRFNIEARGGTTYVEAGDGSPDNIGGQMRLGGWNGTQGDILTLDYRTVRITGTLTGFALRGYIDGLTLSAAGTSSTISIAAGDCTDSTKALVISQLAALTKTTSAWAVGSATGGLDQGAIATNKWYHFYKIIRIDTSVDDVVFSQAPDTARTCTMTIASPCVVTENIHGKEVGAPVVFTTTGALPTGVTAGTTYYVSTVASDNTYNIAATQGGANINTTGTQSGTHTATSAPTLPTNYTYKRYIGSWRTDGSSQWIAGSQVGERVIWAQPINYALGVVVVGGTPQQLSLTAGVPPGRDVVAHVSAAMADTSAAINIAYIHAYRGTAYGASTGTGLWNMAATASNDAGIARDLTCDARAKVGVSILGNATFSGFVEGFTTLRGKNA